MANEVNPNGEFKQECLGACELCKYTRKERFERFLKDVTDIKNKLRTANTEESVNNALDELATFMDHSSKDSDLADIKGFILDIAGTITGVRLHDVTRSALDDLLEKMLNRVNEILAEEKKKENASKLKTLFTELAEHADEIAGIIDIEKIFG